MKIQSIKQQNNSFRGLAGWVAENPGKVAAIAGSSAAAQKIVMSASEVAFSPAIDVGIGEAITKITGEKDGKTRQNSQVQAVRTAAQSIGGAISGVIIRIACIGGVTAALVKAGSKVGSELASKIDTSGTKNLYEMQKNASALGRNIGGLIATVIMIGTNFLIDVPVINFINKKISDVVFKNDKDKEVNNG